jgi:hypothetical protein
MNTRKFRLTWHTCEMHRAFWRPTRHLMAAWLGGRDDVVPGHFFGLGGGWNLKSNMTTYISGVLLLFENNKINLIITLDDCHGQPTLNETQRIYRLASYLVFDVSHRPVLPSPVWTFFKSCVAKIELGTIYVGVCVETNRYTNTCV